MIPNVDAGLRSLLSPCNSCQAWPSSAELWWISEVGYIKLVGEPGPSSAGLRPALRAEFYLGQGWTWTGPGLEVFTANMWLSHDIICVISHVSLNITLMSRWEIWCTQNEEHAMHEMDWCMNTKTNTHTDTDTHTHTHTHTQTHTQTQPWHTSLLYVHRVPSLRSLGILLNTQMLCLNRSSTELIEFVKFLFWKL